jgi:hypothetical protein
MRRGPQTLGHSGERYARRVLVTTKAADKHELCGCSV